MGGKCSPSGGIDIVGPDDPFNDGTRIARNEKVGKQGRPNSRKNLYKDPLNPRQEDLITSRWYDANGDELWDRDYTDHGFPEAHPDEIHDHPFKKGKDGKTQRQSKPQKPNGSC